MSKCRIINGQFKRRFIKAPETKLTRPTSDIVKQSLFNVLIHRCQIEFSEFCVLDCFAGSGSLGFEAISLGSPSGLFIDSNPIAIRCLSENIINLKIENLARTKLSKLETIGDEYFISFSNLFKNILIFMDPPYKEKSLLLTQFNRFKNIFSSKNWVIVIETDENIFDESNFLIHKVKFGNTFIAIFKNF